MSAVSAVGTGSGTAAHPAAPSPGPRRRDASGTTQLLLDAARKLFARNGYQGTTVRDICDEVGVNVALISRYFGSKEGLFRACLAGAVDEIGSTVSESTSPAEVAAAIARQLAGPNSTSHPNHLLLLLRSSQDPEAEQIRQDTLSTFAERLAAAAGGHRAGVSASDLMLKAQIALSAALGIALLRATSALEPLTSASQDELEAPLRQVISALLVESDAR